MSDQSFTSIDRLLDFGISLGAAQQMVQMINSYMQSMYIPGSVQTIQQSFYVVIDDHYLGPLNEKELANLIEQKRVTEESLGWIPGLLEWKPIKQIPSLLKIVVLNRK